MSSDLSMSCWSSTSSQSHSTIMKNGWSEIMLSTRNSAPHRTVTLARRMWALTSQTGFAIIIMSHASTRFQDTRGAISAWDEHARCLSFSQLQRVRLPLLRDGSQGLPRGGYPRHRAWDGEVSDALIGKEITFQDSYQFLGSSLATLANNLEKSGLECFVNLRKTFPAVTEKDLCCWYARTSTLTNTWIGRRR